VGKNQNSPIRIFQEPTAGIDEEEMRVRLRAIVKGEQSSCQLLRLELIAAIRVAKPSPKLRKRADAVLAALAEADRAYGELLAELGRTEST
jgi:hypothetical protein